MGRGDTFEIAEYERPTAGRIAQRGSAQIIHYCAWLAQHDQRMMSPAAHVVRAVWPARRTEPTAGTVGLFGATLGHCLGHGTPVPRAG